MEHRLGTVIARMVYQQEPQALSAVLVALPPPSRSLHILSCQTPIMGI